MQLVNVNLTTVSECEIVYIVFEDGWKEPTRGILGVFISEDLAQNYIDEECTKDSRWYFTILPRPLRRE